MSTASISSARRIALLSAILATSFVQATFAVEPTHPGQETFLTRALFSEGELWVRSDAGQVFRIRENNDTPIKEPLPGSALDLCMLGGHPAALMCDGKDCESWGLRRWDAGKWTTQTTVTAGGDSLIALNCDASSALILTNRRLIELGTPEPRAVALSEEIPHDLVASVYSTADRVFVGLNAGEWGGGLKRIDRLTGRITTIERNASGEPCGGPLNAHCDPVNGIVAEPGRVSCFVAAIGLVHFAPHGRLVEVCGERVQRLYVKAYGDPNRALDKRRKDDEPFETVAFFGLVREGSTLWAAGIDGIYKWEDGEVGQFAPLPDFKSFGPFRVSFALPHLVLVQTSVNQRRSISGAVPMLVPR